MSPEFAVIHLQKRGPQGLDVTLKDRSNSTRLRGRLTRAQLVHVMLGATGVKLLGVDFITVSIYGQRCGDILFFHICPSQIEDNLFGGTSVCNIEFVDLDIRTAQAGGNALGTESTTREYLCGQETQDEQASSGKGNKSHVDSGYIYISRLIYNVYVLNGVRIEKQMQDHQ